MREEKRGRVKAGYAVETREKNKIRHKKRLREEEEIIRQSMEWEGVEVDEEDPAHIEEEMW